MIHTTTISSFPPAVGLPTFNDPNHIYSEEPTNFQQNCSPLVPNYHLGIHSLRDPFYHTDMVPIPSILIAESEFCALYDPREMSVPSPPRRLNPPLCDSTTHNIIPVSSFANGAPPCYIPYTNQPHLHQVDGTTPKALPAPGLSGLPFSSAPLTAQRPQGFPEPTNRPLNTTSAFDQTQIQAAIYPPSTSMTFHGFAAAFSAPLSTASPTTDHSNTVHICQCVTGGSPCNAVVNGSVRSVRNHLKQVHGFRGPGKDTVGCLWAGCEETLQRMNIARHIITRHLHVKVRCVGCGLPLSRRDVQYSHAKVCPARRWTASLLDSDVSSANAR